MIPSQTWGQRWFNDFKVKALEYQKSKAYKTTIHLVLSYMVIPTTQTKGYLKNQNFYYVSLSNHQPINQAIVEKFHYYFVCYQML